MQLMLRVKPAGLTYSCLLDLTEVPRVAEHYKLERGAAIQRATCPKLEGKMSLINHFGVPSIATGIPVAIPLIFIFGLRVKYTHLL
jgi:hypothetical protein